MNSSNSPKYRAILINHGRTADQQFDTVDAAIAWAITRGFSVAVQREGGRVVAGWDVIGGRKDYEKDRPSHLVELRDAATSALEGGAK